MQNVQNIAEIQQRVVNLVELYRRKAGWESQTAKDAKADLEFWNQMSYDMMVEEGLTGGGLYGEGPHTEIWIKKLMVNEQLLGHFYLEVAGEDANQDILDELLPDVYDKTIFTEEEESFLKSHFKEMVNYIIVTPNDDCLELVNRYDSRDAYVIPNEVLELISNRTNIAKGSKILNPYTGFGQFINLYKGCKFYCDVMNAWMKVSVYANNADVESTDVELFESKGSYDAVVSYLVDLSDKGEDVYYLSKAYDSLQPGGLFILLCPSQLLVEGTNPDLRRRLIKDMAIKEIIQLPQVMSNNASYTTYSLIIAEKKRVELTTTLIDARTAQKKLDNKHYLFSFDIEAFNTLIKNDGIDLNAGLHIAVLSSNSLSERMLLPEAVILEQQSVKFKNEIFRPVPLGEICTLETMTIRDVKTDLPFDTPWIKESDLSFFYKGYLDFSSLEKANCPNNPPRTNDYFFNNDGEFEDNLLSQMYSKKGLHVYHYRECTYLDGNNDAILFKWTSENGVCMAMFRATGKPIAVSKGIYVFCPKADFDTLSLLALLRMPEVYRQIMAYKDYKLEKFMDVIRVRTYKPSIYDEVLRMNKELMIYKKQEKEIAEIIIKQKTKLEDYQHAMRKHIREISSSVRRMERFINNMDSSEEIKKYMHERLEVIKTHRLYLSEDIERLNEENTYGEAVPFDIDHCIKNFKDYFGSDGYPIIYSNEVAKESIKRYIESHRKELTEMNETDRKKNIESVKAEKSVTYVDIAEYNFGKAVRNIFENARIHGFSTDTSRNDYMIEIVLSWDSIRNMYRIDFRNNGDPLPDGLSKESYGENRKYAGKTGGTGIGGYEVAETVKHYNGDYNISQDGDWVVVSIFFPKSKLYEQERL